MMIPQNYSGYFDWAAASPPDSDILLKALERAQELYANPSSAHQAGSAAEKLLKEARERCAAILKVPAQRLIFTSGGTESDHLPILSLLQRPGKGSILISALEHPAIREQAAAMKNCGWKVITVQPEKNGIISPENLIKKLENDTALVCVMAVNNETGAIQPVNQIGEALIKISAGKRKPKLHVDAVQALGKVPFSLENIDTAAFSAHKLQGPRGIGLLYMAGRQEPFIRGGEQEGGLRPGTENLFGALALAGCLEKYADKTAVEGEFFSKKGIIAQTAFFIDSLLKTGRCTIIPQERISSPELYSPWIVQASFSRIPGKVLVRALSEKGFYISTGSACSAKKNSRPVLEAMGINGDQSANAVRFSFGPATVKNHINSLLSALTEICQSL